MGKVEGSNPSESTIKNSKKDEEGFDGALKLNCDEEEQFIGRVADLKRAKGERKAPNPS